MKKREELSMTSVSCPTSPHEIWNLQSCCSPPSLVLALQLHLSVAFSPKFQQRFEFCLFKKQDLKDIIKVWYTFTVVGRQAPHRCSLASSHYPGGQEKRKRIKAKNLWVEIKLLNKQKRSGSRVKENKAPPTHRLMLSQFPRKRLICLKLTS